MTCRTCNFPFDPVHLWNGQCIQCVGKERDEMQDKLYNVLESSGYSSDPENTIRMLKEKAKERQHP